MLAVFGELTPNGRTPRHLVYRLVFRVYGLNWNPRLLPMIRSQLMMFLKDITVDGKHYWKGFKISPDGQRLADIHQTAQRLRQCR